MDIALVSIIIVTLLIAVMWAMPTGRDYLKTVIFTYDLA